MRMVSWNVNGLRACVTKGFLDFFKDIDADIFSIQETKLQKGQIDLNLEGYHQYWNYAEKKGYSGVAVFTKQIPINISYGIGIEKFDREGRLITLEFEKFYYVTAYVPNSQDGLKRLDYRVEWEIEIRNYLSKLQQYKPVVYCGDLNVAHNEIDLKNPKNNKKSAGFSDVERENFSKLLEIGFVDTFRYLYKELEGVYSWWSYRFSARQKNAGWRIDYYLVSNSMRENIKEATIHTEIYGSDHCPVSLDIDID